MTDVNTSSVYDASLAYIGRGWAVMPVHGLADPERGVCTCGQFPCGPDNDRAGKHPVQGKWTSLPKMSVADAYATFEEDGPDWNVGIRSGSISGVWFLDIDPKNGGDASLIALLTEHGRLPDTYTVKTGSGGTHYGFRVPAGVIIKSSQRSKRLPAGIDVRGDGGMVIAPPSVSGIGPYELVDGRDPVDAPDWLIELVRVPDQADDFADSPVVEDLPAYAELDEHDRARVQRYAETAVRREAASYEEAPPGTGNSALFAAACNIIEIVQSPWNTLTTLDAVRVLDAARQRRLTTHPGHGQDADEFRKTFGSAQATVVGKGRPMPVDRTDGLLLDVPPFADSPAMAGGDDDGLLLDVGPLPPKQSFLEKLRANLLTAADVLARPNPKPLINGVLDLDSEAWIIGAPGSFKSFVVLDIAGHVGTGKPYHGRRVHQGKVIYLVAEGVTGMKLRVQAWQSVYGPMENVFFIPFAVQAGDPEQWAALLQLVREEQPVLVIIDTQARVTVGMEENGATEMGKYVQAVSWLREASSGCVLTVHHTGRNGLDARGSSAIDGAQGTELKVERVEQKGMVARLLQDKQKDQADTDSIEITMVKVDQGIDPETGRDLSSLVATEASPFTEIATRPSWLAELKGNQLQIAEILRVSADDRGLTTTDIRTAIKERYGDMSRNSFNTAMAALRKHGIVVNGSGGSAHWTLKAVSDDPNKALPDVPAEADAMLQRYADLETDNPDQSSMN